MVTVAHTLVPGRSSTDKKQKQKCFPLLLFARACVRLIRKPRIARFLCAIFKCDLSQRQFGPAVTVIVITIQHSYHYLRDNLRTRPSRLVILQPAQQLGQEELLFLAREIQRGTSCPGPSAPRVPR